MEVLFDPVKRQRAETYQQGKARHDWIARMVTVIGVVLFFGLGWEIPVYEFLTGWTESTTLQIVSYVGGLLSAGWILESIFEYFTTYQMQRFFGLSTQKPGAWLYDQVKYLLLCLVGATLLSMGLLALITHFPTNWWIYGSIAVFILYFLMAFLMPVVLLPLFYKLKPYPSTSLRNRLEQLFTRANVQVAEIYEINLSARTTSSNAAVMGLGKTRKIVLGDTLNERYSDGEIEAIMAHEIGHHVHKDIFKIILMNLIRFVVVSLIIAQVWPDIVEWRGYGALDSVSSLPMLFLTMGVIYWLITPLEKLYSRHLERKADAFALDLIEHPRDLAMAFVKLADDKLSLPQVDWYTLLFTATHPPVGQRIERALSWKKRR